MARRQGRRPRGMGLLRRADAMVQDLSPTACQAAPASDAGSSALIASVVRAAGAVGRRGVRSRWSRPPAPPTEGSIERDLGRVAPSAEANQPVEHRLPRCIEQPPATIEVGPERRMIIGRLKAQREHPTSRPGRSCCTAQPSLVLRMWPPRRQGRVGRYSSSHWGHRLHKFLRTMGLQSARSLGLDRSRHAAAR